MGTGLQRMNTNRTENGDGDKKYQQRVSAANSLQVNPQSTRLNPLPMGTNRLFNIHRRLSNAFSNMVTLKSDSNLGTNQQPD